MHKLTVIYKVILHDYVIHIQILKSSHILSGAFFEMQADIFVSFEGI